MRRRTVLASVASLAALGGCSQLFVTDPVQIRVARAGEERVRNADSRCTLSASFVEDNPSLERLLDAALHAPVGEWVTSEIDRETADALASALAGHCSEQSAIYRFEDESFRVRADGPGNGS